MDAPKMLAPRAVADDTTALPSFMPVPGFGVLPVNAFVLRGAEPVLVDTGLAALRKEFLEALASTVELETLRWIWLTHIDPDHVGNLEAVLRAAPEARVVTSFIGMGKLGLLGLPIDRVHLLNPGGTLSIGDREVAALRVPSFDAPETAAMFDPRSGALFSSDCFGALLSRPTDCAEEIEAAELRDGAVTWATVDAPWLASIDPRRIAAVGAPLQRLDPSAVLSSHLPPAGGGMLGTLLAHIESACSAKRFEGPDQAELERMMAA
jgi:hypothetical protein